MTWLSQRSTLEDLQRGVESLRGDLARLTRAVGDTPSHLPRPDTARRYARMIGDHLPDIAPQAAKMAQALVPSGLSGSWAGRDRFVHKMDMAAHDAREAAARHPAATAIAVVGVGLAVAFVLSLAVRDPRRRRFASPGGNVRRPSANASGNIGRTARQSRTD